MHACGLAACKVVGHACNFSREVVMWHEKSVFLSALRVLPQ